jgi:hypothetical protein
MRFTSHLAMSLALVALYPLFGVDVLTVMLASVVIDIDHVYLIFSKKAFTLDRLRSLHANVYLLSGEDCFSGSVFLFHTVEFITFMALLSVWLPVLLPVAVGLAFHVLIDVVHHNLLGLPVRRWLFLTESLAGGWCENKV